MDTNLRTTGQVALELGLTPHRVRVLAASRGVGRKIGRDHLFTDADVDAMRVRRPGRPPRPRRRSVARA